ncbi:MAG: hypothetical protein ABW061_25510, partial [Polyangiaceae bacterium]
PESVNPRCDAELSRIVLKALANDPADRYATALELQHDLELYSETLGPAAKQKDIARYVTGLFSDTRAQLKALVERQISLIQSDNSSISASRERPRPPGSNTLGGATSESDPVITAQPAPAAGRMKRGLIAGAALLALLGGASFFGWGRHDVAAEPPAVAEKSAAAPLALPTLAAAARVSIDFQATPRQAKLYVDDEALSSNPATKVLPVDGKIHVLRAEAPGFASATTEFSPKQDTLLELALSSADHAAPANQGSSGARRVVGHIGRPIATPAVVAPASAAPTPTPATATAAAPTARPNCDSPIFLDKDGIRRVRPECR